MISNQESDVRLPTLDDFPSDHADNHIFVQKTKLCIALGRLADVRQSSRATSRDVLPVGEALGKWHSDLPGHLKQYEGPGQQPYRRLVSELHIMYHICSIIYLQTLAKLDAALQPAEGAFKECVQHALVIVRKLEPILYRNEVSYLRPINNWFCLVAGVILLRTAGIEDATTYKKELQVLKSVLQDMVPTCPTSALILRSLISRESAVVTAPEWSTFTANDTAGRLATAGACIGGSELGPRTQERIGFIEAGESGENLASAVQNSVDEHFLADIFDLDYAGLSFT